MSKVTMTCIENGCAQEVDPRGGARCLEHLGCTPGGFNIAIFCIEKGCSKEVKPGGVHCNAHQFCPKHLEDVQRGAPPRSICITKGCTDKVHRGALCDAHWEEHCRRQEPPPQAAQYPRQPDPVKDGTLAAFLAEHAAAEKVMTPFGMLRADLELNYKRSPWSQAQGVKGWAESLCSEAEELFDAVRLPRRPPPLCPSCIELRKNHPIKFDHIAHHVHCTADTPKPTEIRDEMGDVLWNLITLAIVTGIDFDAVVQAARDKLWRRKPWIFGIGPMPKTAEEEHQMYTANKSKEKL